MLWNAVQLALRAIRRNVLRSSLTTLGIVIGVGAVIAMVTLGSGATAKVTADIAGLGSNMLQVRPGQGMRGGGMSLTAPMFKQADVDAVANQVGGLKAVTPFATSMTQAIYGNSNWSTVLVGTTSDYLRIRDLALAEGRTFTPNEERAGSNVCLLGDTVHQKLFGRQQAAGSDVRLQNLSCRVVGVIQPKGQTGFGADQDDYVLVPLRTFQRRIAGNTDVGGILVSARDGVSTTKVKSDLQALFRERRHIAPGKDDDFFVMDMQELVSMLTGTTRVLTLLLGAVAGISLLVGGIGIMNIMLVSVTERTREIGIRLAVGAYERDVLSQFLVEAIVLASLGGVFGVVLGLAAGTAGARALGVPFVFRPGVVLLAFTFAAAVGILFGFFPARRAARLNPIEALRHE
ncbi:MAG TPA: ABC transporter permease [Gammaproteobacteria bacterium]|jgi:putative ABC transport system permease protein|nr:ABC transporter permease [Gammaproteobacteria bacterium]